MSSPLPRRVPKPRSPKQCSKCKEWLPIECFDRKSDSPDFHATECRACKWERKKPTRLAREEALRIALRQLMKALTGSPVDLAIAKCKAARLLK